MLAQSWNPASFGRDAGLHPNCGLEDDSVGEADVSPVCFGCGSCLWRIPTRPPPRYLPAFRDGRPRWGRAFLWHRSRHSRTIGGVTMLRGHTSSNTGIDGSQTRHLSPHPFVCGTEATGAGASKAASARFSAADMIHLTCHVFNSTPFFTLPVKLVNAALRPFRLFCAILSHNGGRACTLAEDRT